MLQFDVIVIDEIQMIEDRERGFAWTRALMGLRCKEIHCCGGLEAVSLIQKIANVSNDDFELKRYERFSTLTVAEKSLATIPEERGSYRSVRFQRKLACLTQSQTRISIVPNKLMTTFSVGPAWRLRCGFQSR
jgi:ATP-dependent RNA helicase SUPV3L1/SUV3